MNVPSSDFDSMFRDSIQFILCVLIIRTVLTLQGRIDLARILLALVVGGLCI